MVWSANSLNGTYALYRLYISTFTNLGAHLLIKMNNETRLNESGREASACEFSHARHCGVTHYLLAPARLARLRLPRKLRLFPVPSCTLVASLHIV
jgi:hypothetical protein